MSICQLPLAVAVDIELNLGINVTLDAVWHVICAGRFVDRTTDLFKTSQIPQLCLNLLEFDGATWSSCTGDAGSTCTSVCDALALASYIIVILILYNPPGILSMFTN
jgi:hypothetical protein